MLYKEVKRKEYGFYIYQFAWLLDEYYNNNTIEPFVLINSDNISSLEENAEIHIEFGIKNNNFDCKSKDVIFRKKEFINLVDRLKKIKNEKEYEEEYCFIDSTLIFKFWCDQAEEFLDIEYNYRNDCCDYYSLALNQNEIEILYKLLLSQIK